jgi:hypothetical protein
MFQILKIGFGIGLFDFNSFGVNSGRHINGFRLRSGIV